MELSCPTPPKSIMEIGQVVKKLNKKVENDAKCKVRSRSDLKTFIYLALS